MHARALRRLLNGHTEPSLRVLIGAWRARGADDRDWRRDPDLYRRCARGFLAHDELLLALDATDAGLHLVPGDPDLLQARALTKARLGAWEEARALLDALRQAERAHESSLDEETLGLEARTYKDAWLLGRGTGARTSEDLRWLDGLRREAFERYRTAYHRAGGSYWLGINVAALACGPVGYLTRSALDALLSEVEAACRGASADGHASGREAYFALATQGEAEVIRGDISAAVDWFRRAVEAAPNALGYHRTTVRQVDWIADSLSLSSSDRARLTACFPRPTVVIFAADPTAAANPRPHAPDASELRVRAALEGFLDRVQSSGTGPLVGFTGAAAGPEILFLEAIEKRGGYAHVVLPYDEESFVEDWVEREGEGWKERFQQVIATANLVHASTSRPVALAGYDYCDAVMLGLALGYAREHGATVTPLVVSDRSAFGGVRSSAATANVWRRYGVESRRLEVDVGAPRATAAGLGTVHRDRPPDGTAADSASVHRVRTLLFGDVVSYSRLEETQVAAFVETFLGGVALILERVGSAPLLKDTWGDAIHVVFETAREAGCFALDVVDFVAHEDWASRGLPYDLNVRIGLHTGPTYMCEDPISKKTYYTGTHASRAARIERSAEPGRVYASTGFAAYAILENVSTFDCHYVGQRALEKDYGTYAIYEVRRRRSDCRDRARREGG